MIRDGSLCFGKDAKLSKIMSKRKVKLSRTPGFRSAPYSPNRLQITRNVDDMNKKAPVKNGTSTIVIPDGVELKAVKCKGGVIENKFNKQVYSTPPALRDQQDNLNLEPLQIEPISYSPRRRLAEDSMTSPKLAVKARVIKTATFVGNTKSPKPKRCLLRREPNDFAPISSVPFRARTRGRLTEQDKDVLRVKKEVQGLRRENRSLRSLLTELKLKNVTSEEDGKRTRKVSFSDEISKLASNPCMSTTVTTDKEHTTNDNPESKIILEKKLKQANEMVMICLGKVREAERKSSKIPQLEMEIMVLRRQLAEKRSGRLNSRDSTISDDCILRGSTDNSNKNNSSDSQADLVESFEKENVFLESPITNSLQRASLAFTSSGEISYSSPPSSIECAVNRKTLERRSRFDSRVSSDSNKSDDDVRNFTTSTSRDTLSSYASVDTETYERLLKQHDEAMELVKNLESKFLNQQSEMKTLHTEIKSVTTKTNKRSRHNSSDDMGKLIKRLHKHKVSHQTLGKLLYFTLDKKNEQGKSKDLEFSSVFSDVVRNSGLSGIDSFSSV